MAQTNNRCLLSRGFHIIEVSIKRELTIQCISDMGQF